MNKNESVGPSRNPRNNIIFNNLTSELTIFVKKEVELLEASVLVNPLLPF